MTSINKYYSIFLLGFYSLISQILIIREIFIIFSGNEITTGIILSLWLGGSAAGNFFSKKLFHYFYDKRNSLFFINLIFLLFNIVAVRYFPVLFRFTFGELIPLLYLFIYATILIFPFSLLWGVNFNYFYISLKNDTHRESKIYFIESFGAAVGSLFITFISIRFNSVFLVINILFILLLFSLLLEKKYNHMAFYFLLPIIIVLSLFHKPLSQKTERWRFFKTNLVSSRETPYGKLNVIQQGRYYSFYNNGILLYSQHDTLTPEIESALAVSQSESINNVLVINNGVSGLIKNLLTYEKIKKITYIEYNKYLYKQSLHYLPSDYMKNEKVQVIINDPGTMINKITDKYNIIFLNNNDPYNLYLNRFFSYEYFNKLKSVLASDGIILLKISSSENYINREQSLYTGSIYKTLKSVFKDVLLIPGDTCYILTSDKKNVITQKKSIIKKRIKKFNIQSDFFKNYFFKFNFNEFRINSFFNVINLNAKKNYDLYPVSFFYNTILWTTRTSQTIKSMFYFLYGIPFYIILIFFILAYTILNLTLFKQKQRVILLSMGTIGFTEISLEIISILLYQVIRGNLYINMGFIFFSFMSGLSLGSYLFRYIKIRPQKTLLIIQSSFIIIPGLLLANFYLIRLVNITILQDALFFLFILGFSTLSGLQFPTAAVSFPDKIFGPGIINGIDLLFGSIGALTISLFIIPLYGIFNTIILLTIINLMASFRLFFKEK